MQKKHHTQERLFLKIVMDSCRQSPCVSAMTGLATKSGQKHIMTLPEILNRSRRIIFKIKDIFKTKTLKTQREKKNLLCD